MSSARDDILGRVRQRIGRDPADRAGAQERIARTIAQPHPVRAPRMPAISPRASSSAPGP
jgi:hypothetical protein